MTPTATINESVLTARIAAGDQEAFAAWLAGAEPRLRAGLAGFATVVDVEAVMQEALFRTWRLAAQLQPDGRPDGLLRLALRIARNLAIDELRRCRPQRLTPELLAASEEDQPPPAVAEGEDAAQLRSAIEVCRERLPVKQRQTLELRLRTPEAREAHLARALDMKPNTFCQYLRRARRSLAECLARHGFNLEFRP